MATTRQCPKRKIVHCCAIRPRSRRGLICLATLECAHLDDCGARERRRGWVYCFDCFYGKPQSVQAVITLEEITRKQKIETSRPIVQRLQELLGT